MSKKKSAATQPKNNNISIVAVDPNTVLIDGSFGEGGGQVLRNSFSLSTLLQKPIKISNIRAKRPKPGLAAQHLTGIQMVSKMSNGKLIGGRTGSVEVLYAPGKLQSGVFEADTGTAGSICLLIQVTFPCMIFGPGDYELTYKGGTNAICAPPVDYLQRIFKPFVTKFGINFDMDLIMRGFYPRGGGIVKVRTKPVLSLQPITVLERGEIIHIELFAFCSGVIQEQVPKRMVETAAHLLQTSLVNPSIKYTTTIFKEPKEKAFGEGTAIMVIAETSSGCLFAGSGIGEKGKKAEDVGAVAANQLIKDLKHGGCVDEYLQDQIILFMALADGVSRIKVGPLSEHTTTSIHFSEILTGAKFNVTEAERKDGEETFLLECKGIGYKNMYSS